MEPNATARKILMVDDEERNLFILEGILAPVQYTLDRATTGQEAMEKVLEDPPDLILLDVMMPGLSGFDVCRHLKSQEETRFIPILLVTALSDKDSKIQGAEAGADDFISKPVDPNELRTRVKSLLRIRALYDELQQRYEQLHQLEVMRETLTQMIVHDLRNPLVAVRGFVDLLEMSGYVADVDAAQSHLRALKMSALTLTDMVTAILDLSKLEAGEMQLDRAPVSVEEVICEVQEGAASLLSAKSLEVDLDLPPDLPHVLADRECLRRTLVNILGNAMNFSPSTTTISISARPEDKSVKVSVSDRGPGIPQEDQARIFEKFGQIHSRQSGRKYSTGLGLTFCKMAVEAHGGEIGVDSQEGQGSTFWLRIPAT